MTLADWLTKSLDGTLEIPHWSENPHQVSTITEFPSEGGLAVT
jgi:hypothetical protein